MAYDLLTTSGINSLVYSYTANESQNKVTPLETRKNNYSAISSIYSNLLIKVDALKSKTSILKATGSSSVFAVKKAVSSNTTAVTVNASSTAQKGAFTLRVNQLAKNDLVVSLDKNSNDFSSITSPGIYTFAIKGGDGEGGQFTSNVSLELKDSDFTNGNISFKNLSNKIVKAINDDKAIVTSNAVSGDTLSTGSFSLNLNGTETTINYSAGSYEEVIDNIISQLKDISGISAEKVADGSNLRLKLTVSDSAKYISINADTGSLLSELGISVDKEKGASGIVSATSFSPSNELTQISFTAKNSGAGFKIEDLSDISGGILGEFGLNLGSSRAAFVQDENGLDTAGYVHNLPALNSKITFNGLNIERNSNTINDIIAGVTLNLKSVMSNDENDVTIDVSNDASAVKAKIDEFITSFNDLYTYIKTNSSSSNGVRGTLIGDSSGSSLLGILSSTAYLPVSGLGVATINSLSKMGITFNTATGLSVTNEDQLNQALENNMQEVEEAFNSDSGIAASLFNRLSPYTGPSGYLTSRKNTIDTNVERINDSITQIKSRIDKDAENLRNRYIQLQAQLSSLLSSSGMFGNDLLS